MFSWSLPMVFQQKAAMQGPQGEKRCEILLLHLWGVSVSGHWLFHALPWAGTVQLTVIVMQCIHICRMCMHWSLFIGYWLMRHDHEGYYVNTLSFKFVVNQYKTRFEAISKTVQQHTEIGINKICLSSHISTCNSFSPANAVLKPRQNLLKNGNFQNIVRSQITSWTDLDFKESVLRFWGWGRPH